MFSGIVTDCGRVCSLVSNAGGLVVSIATSWDVQRIAKGASIACSGVCLTLTEKADDRFSADVSRETMSRTTLGLWRVGSRVNLEQSLAMGGEIGGHLVFGHVDRVATVCKVEQGDDSTEMTLCAPAGVAPFIAEKGSVAVDGVSLTVTFVEDRDQDCEFGVSIIPHTRHVTTFSAVGPGDRVNLEVDMLARYVQRLVTSRHR